MATSLVSVSIRSKGVVAEVILNGFRLYAVAQADGRSSGFKANEWVVDGTNSVRISCGRFGLSPNPAALFEMKVFDADGASLFAYEWENTADEASLTPESVDGRFSLPQAGRSWSWQSAPQLSLSGPIRDEIIDMLSDVHSRLAEMDVDGVLERLSIKNRDLAAAYGIPLERFEEGMRNFLQTFFDDPDWQMRPFAPEELTFDLHAGGRVVGATMGLSAPPLTSAATSEGATYQLDGWAAQIDGRFRLVR